jgi:phosphate:Na+ symporter
MNLMQAIGVVLGANIGTTITGWIIAIKIGKYSLLLIGLAFLPMMQGKSERLASWGKLLFALGMVFLGLQTMSGAFKPLRSEQIFLDMMTYFSADSYGTLWATIAIGCLLTFIVQSSSAMLGITIALAISGAITFQTSAGLVLGENIGTTITALLAGMAGNRNAKRAALAHAVFNVFGVLVISTFFWKYLTFIEGLVEHPADFVDADGGRPYIAAHIAAGHSVFNVVNVIIFLPIMGILAKAVTYIYPEREVESQHLNFLGSQKNASPSLAIVQAKQELILMGELVDEMIGWTMEFISDPKKNYGLRKKILKREAITDAIHQEMLAFLGHIIRKRLTTEESYLIKRALKTSDELESLADYCQKVVQHQMRVHSEGSSLDQETRKDLTKLIRNLQEFYREVMAAFKSEEPMTKDRIFEYKDAFDRAAEKVRDAHLSRVMEKSLPLNNNLTVGDIVLSLNRIFSHTRNVAEWQLGEKNATGQSK